MTSMLECYRCGTTDVESERDIYRWDYNRDSNDPKKLMVVICRDCLQEFYEWVIRECPIKIVVKNRDKFGELIQEWGQIRHF